MEGKRARREALESVFSWRVFVAVASSGSVSRAALETGLPISTVSRVLSEFEAAAGGPLFDRSKRPLRLTPRGEHVRAAVKPALDAAESCLAALRSEERSPIRLSTPAGIGRFYVPRELTEYASVDPKAEFQLFIDMAEGEVLSGACDVALFPGVPAPDDRLRVTSAIKGWTAPLASRRYLAEHGEPKRPEDLVRHTGILKIGERFEETESLVRGSESCPIGWRRTAGFEDMMSLKTALLEGKGITVDLPLGMVLSEIESGEVRAVLSGWHRPAWTYSLVTLRHARPEVEAFAIWYGKAVDRDINGRREKGFRLLEAKGEWRAVAPSGS